MTRQEDVAAAIVREDPAELMGILQKLCACMGPVDGEPLCRCAMTSLQITRTLSYAALRRGKIVRLKR